MILLAAVVIPALALAGDKLISPDKLPEAAHTFIAKHYPGQEIVSVARETIFDDYEVLLKNGTELEFSSKGAMDKVEAKRGETLPHSLIATLPAAIPAYVAKNYPKAGICAVSIERKRIEVRVTAAGRELIFDAKGQYLGADD